MATDNTTETLHEISQRLDDAYQATLDVDAMLRTLRAANSGTPFEHMCELIIERNGTVSEVLERADQHLKEAGGAS